MKAMVCALCVCLSFAAVSLGQESPGVVAVRKVKSSVVAVKVQRTSNQGKTRDTIGCGLIVGVKKAADDELNQSFVITNRHVVAGATKIVVRLLDGTEVSADVHVADAAEDLAILRISTDKKLVHQVLVPSKDLEEGQEVLAIGHPYSFFYTVSKGIISALNRQIVTTQGQTLTGLIQTDAAINPGNSGGPLVNIDGRVIGIMVADREGAQGIAFAISAKTVERFLKKHLQD